MKIHFCFATNYEMMKEATIWHEEQNEIKAKFSNRVYVRI